MKTLNILSQRLNDLGLLAPKFEKPADVVKWLGAVQSQDFAGAKWALGLRMKKATDGMIEKAFNAGLILRTHVLRPTWHFVHPKDIRWMLELTAPRVHAVSAFMYRKTGLDVKLFQRSNKILEKALRDGRQLTRDELRDALEKDGLSTIGEQRMTYLMMQAELDGVVCSGPRKGKQFTYMLLEERVSPTKKLNRDEALVELVTRYFTSRGPATIQDFAKWSGLTIADTKLGLEAVKSQFQNETIEGQIYWFKESKTPKVKIPFVHLLSIFDEYISSYKDRSAIGTQEYGKKLAAMGNDLTSIILINGQIVGTWKRELKPKEVIFKPNFFIQPSTAEKAALMDEVKKYGIFLELPISMQ